jgi:hypothetical protein
VIGVDPLSLTPANQKVAIPLRWLMAGTFEVARQAIGIRSVDGG